MSRYILNARDEVQTISKVVTEDFYTFSPKGAKYTRVKSVTIYEEERIQKLVIKRLMIRYQKILQDLANLFASDDTSSDGYLIILDEVSKLKDMLELKYKKYLKKELYDNFLDDLMKISKVLQEKIEEANIAKGR